MIKAERRQDAKRRKEFNSILAIIKPLFAKMKPAVFLDRDGVLIEERNYLHHVEDVMFLPGWRRR